MMHSRTLPAALVWLAALALAAQGLGAPALLDSCCCRPCECSSPKQEQPCCSNHAAPADLATCCRAEAASCLSILQSAGSCCCSGTELPTPANLPKNNKTSHEKPITQQPLALISADALPPNSAAHFETQIRHESPPPRILYCVWRN